MTPPRHAGSQVRLPEPSSTTLASLPNTCHLQRSFLLIQTGSARSPAQRTSLHGSYVNALCADGPKPDIGRFPLVANPALSPDAADAHWRDHHAPLALEIHEVMTHYRQLCVIQHLHGLALDGIALCGTATAEDLRERFFRAADGRRAILRDIASFADTEKSPRRLIATETEYG